MTLLADINVSLARTFAGICLRFSHAVAIGAEVPYRWVPSAFLVITGVSVWALASHWAKQKKSHKPDQWREGGGE